MKENTHKQQVYFCIAVNQEAENIGFQRAVVGYLDKKKTTKKKQKAADHLIQLVKTLKSQNLPKSLKSEKFLNLSIFEDEIPSKWQL